MVGWVDVMIVLIGSYLLLFEYDDLYLLVDVCDYFVVVLVVFKVDVVKCVMLIDRVEDLDRVLVVLMLVVCDYVVKFDLWIGVMEKVWFDVVVQILQQFVGYYVQNWMVNGGVQKDEMLFVQIWYGCGFEQNLVYLVDLVKWLDLWLMDRVLVWIGIDVGGDKVLC